MVAQQLLPLSITLIIILALISRAFVPWAGRPSGALVRRVPLSLLGRLRMHGVAGIVLLVAGTLAALSGLALLVYVAVALVVLAALIAAPMSYTLTTKGIMAGRTPMRRWTEFGGVTRTRGGVRLQGVAGARGMTVWLSGSRDDDETVLLLRQLVRGAYKGEVGPELSQAGADDLASTVPTTAFDHAGAGVRAPG
jgi:hypothetical protein